jgi:RNA polymerase-binding transcription factor DksA
MASTTVRYSDDDLHEFKSLIDTKLGEAQRQLQFMRDQMIEINENNTGQQSGDWTDESSSHSEMELLTSQISRQHLFVRNLENALLRIRNKTYGICAITGQLINKRRLLLVPHATKSIEAKQSRPNHRTVSAGSDFARRMTEEEDAANNTTDAL